MYVHSSLNIFFLRNGGEGKELDMLPCSCANSDKTLYIHIPTLLFMYMVKKKKGCLFLNNKYASIAIQINVGENFKCKWWWDHNKSAIFIFGFWLKVWNCIHFQLNNKTYFDGYLSLLFQLKKRSRK